MPRSPRLTDDSLRLVLESFVLDHGGNPRLLGQISGKLRKMAYDTQSLWKQIRIGQRSLPTWARPDPWMDTCKNNVDLQLALGRAGVGPFLEICGAVSYNGAFIAEKDMSEMLMSFQGGAALYSGFRIQSLPRVPFDWKKVQLKGLKTLVVGNQVTIPLLECIRQFGIGSKFKSRLWELEFGAI